MTASQFRPIAKEVYGPALQESLDRLAGEGVWEDTVTTITARVEFIEMDIVKPVDAKNLMLTVWARLRAEALRVLVPLPVADWREAFRGGGCE